MSEEKTIVPKAVRVYMRPGQASTVWVDVPWDSFTDLEVSTEGALMFTGEGGFWHNVFAPGAWSWLEYV